MAVTATTGLYKTGAYKQMGWVYQHVTVSIHRHKSYDVFSDSTQGSTGALREDAVGPLLPHLCFPKLNGGRFQRQHERGRVQKRHSCCWHTLWPLTSSCQPLGGPLFGSLACLLLGDSSLQSKFEAYASVAMKQQSNKHT
jgi:hypothetical protein